MGGIMPTNERHRALPVVLLFTIPPVWTDRADPVNFGVRGASKGSIGLP